MATTPDGARDNQAAPLRHSRLRFLVMILGGLAVALTLGFTGHWLDAPAAGWATAAAIYTAWVWLVIARMDPQQTKAHATAEDPSRGVTDLLVLGANVASLGAVAVVVINSHTQNDGGKLGAAALALTSVSMSWALIHTLFTLRYASHYYGGAKDGGVSFNQDEPPRYTDFAYLATSLGMTYQVSDTNLENSRIRLEALKHSLLSFLFGTVILAATLNLVIGLAN
ncbi:DUF1345 domain-containing protein [Pseudarthrobacter sp. J1738]|uniref:DUF1345 domain-containing protein n=1 Tax=unclassified Pseudarthrobacter TaxID=2647000 RepID=UPI003D2E1992